MGMFFDMHQISGGQWKWHAAMLRHNQMIVSRRSWDTRPECAAALKRIIPLIEGVRLQ